MDEGQDNANKASGGSAAGAQGIFSTPELTVDTEKIAQNNTNNEKKRVASIFANTDAGQRSQKLNNAMGVSSQPITEDLVIQNEPKKKSKLPIILVVVVLIAVVGGLVGWMVIQAIANNPAQIAQTPLSSFNEFVELLEKGPRQDNTEGSEGAEPTSDWFITTLSDSSLTSSERTEYVKNLLEKFSSFSNQTAVMTSLDDDSKSLLDNYKQSMKIYIIASATSYYSQQILEKFADGGKQATIALIDSLTPEDFGPENGSAGALNRETRGYLLTEANIVEIYQRAGCVENMAINPACSVDANTNSSALPEAYTSQEEYLASMDFYLPTVRVQLSALESRVKKILEDYKNEK